MCKQIMQDYKKMYRKEMKGKKQSGELMHNTDIRLCNYLKNLL